MSQDLLAAFGFAEDLTQQTKPANSASLLDDFQGDSTESSGLSHGRALIDNDDEWGEFESAELATAPRTEKPQPARYQYDLDDLGPAKPSILQGRNKRPLQPTAIVTKPESKPKYALHSKDPNVLFDASEPSEDDDDDFGDFESSNVQTSFESRNSQTSKLSAQFDLLGLDDGISSSSSAPIPQAQKVERAKPLNIVDSNADEPWDDIPEAGEKPTETVDQTLEISLSVFPGVQDPQTEDTIPPTNVPPPSIVLSLFPAIFETVTNDLLQPLSQKSDRQKVLSDQGTTEYLRGYVIVLTVLARVIAGRKQRWKRDQILAQSVRIGQAGKSGMKVTSIDKAEVGREDREVAEVLRLWNLQAGRIKSIISEAKKTPNFGLLPELRETMPVRSAKELEGGIVSTKPCALCGLKREERIGKVDTNVMDSFGEWWIERTNMHRACRNFWVHYETILRSR